MVISAPPIASMTKALAPEMQVVLCCARLHMDEAMIDQLLQLLQQPLDWDRIIDSALTHRVTPLLYQNLNTHAVDQMPADVLADLHQVFHDNQLDNLALTQELLKLCKLLTEHQIATIPFKGPLLATTVYQNLALRTFSDLDILVHPSQLLEARELLLAHGYQSFMQHVYVLNSLRQEKRLIRVLGECPLQHSANLFCIDLHQRLVAGEFYNLSGTFTQVWYRLETVSLLGTPVPNLHPEDLLLYLCIHGAKDRWQRLSWVCDVAELVRQQTELDWASLLQQAQWSGTEQMLLLGLVLARDLLGLELPDAIAAAIETNFRKQQLADQVRLQLTQKDDIANLNVNLWQRFRFSFQLLERFDDRCRCSFRLIANLLRPTPADREFYSLPGWLHLFYPVVRLVRFLRPRQVPEG